jgi:hypothetical protein
MAPTVSHCKPVVNIRLPQIRAFSDFLANLHTNKPSSVIEIVLFVTHKGLFVTEITLFLANKSSFAADIVLFMTNKTICIVEIGLSVTEKPSSVAEIGLFAAKIGLFVVEIPLFVTDLVLFGLNPFNPRAPFHARGQRQPCIHCIKLGILVSGSTHREERQTRLETSMLSAIILGQILDDDVFGGTPKTACGTRACPCGR